MKRFVLGLGCVLAMLPGVASAALSVGPTPPTVNVVAGAVPTGEQTMDLVFTDTGQENEGLFAYDLYVNRDKSGVNLARAEKPDNWVLSAPDAQFVQADQAADHILVNAFGSFNPTTPLDDITTGKKAARIVYTLDPGIAPGDYKIFLDPTPATTVFVSGDPAHDPPELPVDISQGFIVHVTPEPASLSLIGIAGLLALRRRRAA